MLNKRSKKIGRMQRPTSKKVFPDKEKATVVQDTLEFHGTEVRVRVNNAYKSKLHKFEFTVAAGRSATLREDNVECSVSDHRIDVAIDRGPPRKGRHPPSAAMVSELRKKELEKVPVFIRFDERGRFAGITILR